ncbi:MAG: DUF3365 domain-containing protein [Pseudomonadales bacterium]|nr:DUF3365 domain-containing protein [Pseudomonadales bacterium]
MRLALLLVLIPSWAAADEADLRMEAKSLVQTFAGELKPALLSAIEEGGPVNAIEVCATRAPAIARSLSEESGWQVRRVSLKPRNADTATTDDWATPILREFNERLADGEPASQLVHAEVVEGEFRFLKAQPVEPLCLICHGQSIDPAVKAKIAELYPDDSATGYSLGEIRGAFYLTRSL